jgi:hypothetical protein
MLTGSYLYTNVLFWSNACTVGSTLPDSAIEKQWVDMNCCAPPRAIGNPKQMITDLGLDILFLQVLEVLLLLQVVGL